MRVKLVVARGPARAQTIWLRSAQTIVGRQKGCGVRIPSAEVSRRHCRLSFEHGQVMIEDLDSANGTFVNGKQIAAKEVVRPGDQLQVGPIVFTVQYQLPKQAMADVLPAEPQEPVPEVLAANEEEELLQFLPVEMAAEPTRPQPAEESVEAVVELDDAEIGHLPEGKDLRDILNRLDR